MSTSPYQGLPARAFWKSGVVERTSEQLSELYEAKYEIRPKAKIATAGSCFAQHVGRYLREAKLDVMDVEPLPEHVPVSLAHSFGYRLYSGRYGNIYTIRQLLQLHQECYGEFSPAEAVWEKDGRYFDAVRPSVEPSGLDSPEAVMKHRARHLAAVREMFDNCNLFVFTFGLTETFEHIETGTVYPTAPGTIAGEFDPEKFRFVNFKYEEVLKDFLKFRKRMRNHRGGIKFLVTVSPVPLTATASGKHVELSTCYSKSVLRAVCGEISTRFPDVDYFPSYEVITSVTNRGEFYEDNLRQVKSVGVDTALGLFLSAHGFAEQREAAKQSKARAKTAPKLKKSVNDLVCEELLLEKFA